MSTDVDAEKKSYKKVTGLEQNVLYNLRVFGYSRGGEGLASSPSIQFILGKSIGGGEGGGRPREEA